MPFALNAMNESRFMKNISRAANISKATDLDGKRIHIKELDDPHQINVSGKRTEHDTCFAGHKLQSIVSLVQSLHENVVVLPCRAFKIITHITGLLRMNRRNKYILAGQMLILSDHEYAASRVASVYG